MPLRKWGTGNRLYCSDLCRAGPIAETADGSGVPCPHCSRLFVKTHARQKYCSGPCRIEHHKAKYAAPPVEGDDGPLVFRELHQSPRRLRVAHLFAVYNGAALDDSLPPVVTPPKFLTERRYGRA